MPVIILSHLKIKIKQLLKTFSFGLQGFFFFYYFIVPNSLDSFISVFFFSFFRFSRKSRLENDFLFMAPEAPRDQEGIVDPQDPQGGPVNREVLEPRADPVL